MTVKYRHNGQGYLPGVPARDLTAEDLDALTPEQRQVVEENAKLEQGAVYEAVSVPKRGQNEEG